MKSEKKVTFNQRIPESLEKLITQEAEVNYMTKTDVNQIATTSWILSRVASRVTGLPFVGIAAIHAALERLPYTGDVFRGKQDPSIAMALGWRELFHTACKECAFSPEDKEAGKRLKAIVNSMPETIREKIRSEVARVIEVSK